MISTKPLVSICIPNYNTEKFIAATIRSALAQTYKRKEVIVVDDCSTDGSWKIIHSFRGRVKAFKNKKNLGYPGNMNRCVSLVKGKYIVLLNSDDLLERHAVEKQVELMEKHPSVALVHGTARTIDESGKEIGWIRTHDSSYVMAGMQRLATLLEGNSIVCSSVMIRKSNLPGSEPFDTGIYFCADWDLWMRLCFRHNIAYIADTIASYRVRESSMSSTYSTKKLAGVDQLKAIRKILDLLNSDPALKDAQNRYRIFERRNHYFSILAVEQLVRSLQLTATGHPKPARKHVLFAAEASRSLKFLLVMPFFYALTFLGKYSSAAALKIGRALVKTDRLYTAEKYAAVEN